VSLLPLLPGALVLEPVPPGTPLVPLLPGLLLPGLVLPGLLLPEVPPMPPVPVVPVPLGVPRPPLEPVLVLPGAVAPPEGEPSGLALVSVAPEPVEVPEPLVVLPIEPLPAPACAINTP